MELCTSWTCMFNKIRSGWSLLVQWDISPPFFIPVSKEIHISTREAEYNGYVESSQFVHSFHSAVSNLETSALKHQPFLPSTPRPTWHFLPTRDGAVRCQQRPAAEQSKKKRHAHQYLSACLFSSILYLLQLCSKNK
eukprot:1147460-Pelagomonas_calceolata.AAC.5